MNMTFYQNLPDYYPKKEAKMNAAREIISTLKAAGFDRQETEEVLDLVKGEIASYTADIPIGILEGLKTPQASEEG